MASSDPKRPNILFILSDDQGPWAMNCAGTPELRTPNLNRLAETGIRFDHFFCTSPVCSPARASLMTGRIPSQHGVHDWIAAGDTIAKYEPVRNGELIEYLAEQPGYTDYLAAAGYTCGISGKWHMGDSHHAQKSMSFWKVHSKGGGPYYNAPLVDGDEVYEEPRYVTDVFTDNALEFLDTQKDADAPFYLSVHYTAPHAPWGRDQHPKELFDHYHDNCDFASVPHDLEPPEWALTLAIPVKDEEQRINHLSGYFASIEAMDTNVGRMLDYLEANGLRENTLVVFTADNGMNMGHHGVFGKGNATFPMNMFEESVKVPFLVSRPGHVPQGEICSSMFSQYDLMPTLLDYIDAENPQSERLPGTSFAGVLRGEPIDGREHVVVYDEYGPVRMVRTREHKYIHRYPYGPHELYDLVNDSGETTNLIGDAAHTGLVTELRGRLQQWFHRYVDPARDGTNEAVTGSGQRGLCGPTSEGREAFSQARVADLLAEKFKRS